MLKLCAGHVLTLIMIEGAACGLNGIPPPAITLHCSIDNAFILYMPLLNKAYSSESSLSLILAI